VRLAGVWVLALAACPSAEGKRPEVAKVPAVALAAAPAPKKVPVDPADEHYPMPALPPARVTLPDAFGGKHVVEVEVCADDVSRTRGMMWRRELAAGKGMIFVFATEQVHSFWMRNTLIPLDMIFITRDLKIAGIVSNAEPKTTTSRTVGKPSLYVLEVPGGWSEKVGLKVGGAVQLEGLAGVTAAP
jgi:uncharacterized membrane protein (UPF0127 family)